MKEKKACVCNKKCTAVLNLWYSLSAIKNQISGD